METFKIVDAPLTKRRGGLNGKWKDLLDTLTTLPPTQHIEVPINGTDAEALRMSLNSAAIKRGFRLTTNVDKQTGVIRIQRRVEASCAASASSPS